MNTEHVRKLGTTDDDMPRVDASDEPCTPPEDVATPIAPWLRASAADLGDCDFEGPIAGLVSADIRELSEAYRLTVHSAGADTAGGDTPELRIFSILWAITGMHLKAYEREEPYGPMLVMADGRRSAIPEDFRDGHIDLLADLAMRATNPVLRARLADVTWWLDRKRGKLATAAIMAYIDSIESIEIGTLKFPYGNSGCALEHGTRDMRCRALHIGRTIGWDKAETIRARAAVSRLSDRAIAQRSGIAVLWFAGLDLDFGVSDPAMVAAGVEEVLASESDSNVHLIKSLWRLAARGYHLAKKEGEKFRCQIAAAESLAGEAERLFAGQGAKRASAMLASNMMSDAIAQLHGAPNAKDLRIELRHRLVDLQARIPDEMSVYSHQWDIKEIAGKVRDAIGECALLDQLFLFAAISESPEPAALVVDAEQSIQEHPLSTLFAAVYYDREGKAVHRTDAAGFGTANEAVIRRRIAENEAIRRNFVASAQIEAARQAIISRHFLRETLLVSIFEQSPFVPPELVATFGRAFLRFFQGDFVSAIYILTPLLENSLRHVLKLNGYDVTSFHDATQTQQNLTITQLFGQMREEMDEAFTNPITTDIENLFLNRPGPHLRHNIAHGLAHDGTPYGPDAIYGCWLIFRLCLMPLLPYRDQLRDLVE